MPQRALALSISNSTFVADFGDRRGDVAKRFQHA